MRHRYAATIRVDGKEKTIAVISKPLGVPTEIFEQFISTLNSINF